MRERDHLGARRQELLELVDQEIAVVVDRRPFDHGALPLAQEVPGHDVGMVLHDREHDLVALLQSLAAEGVGDEIDRLGGVAGEDDLFRPSGIEERTHLLARAFVGLGRGIGEVMQAAMHIGVFVRVGVLDAIEHRLRLLRRGRVVEIDERLAIDLHAEDREILADAGDVIGAVGDCGMHGHARLASQAATCSIKRVAQARVLDALDRLADKGLDHQRLGLLGRDAARLEIEQQVLVERAGGGAMAALDVVGKDFELGLVVGLGESPTAAARASPSWRRSSGRAAAR